MAKRFAVYMLTNPGCTVIYTGVTSNLKRRVYEHRHKLVPGFTKRYNVVRLVYYEACDTAYAAIAREKQIKAGSRRRKVALIESVNPEWRDLFEEL